MKRALVTMFGLAAMTLPALAQTTEVPVATDASRAPQVEIPEGAFEIVLPNLGITDEIPTRETRVIINAAAIREQLSQSRERIRMRRVERTDAGTPARLLDGDSLGLTIEFVQEKSIGDAEAPEATVVAKADCLGSALAAAPHACRAAVRIIVDSSGEGRSTMHRIIVIAGDSLADPIHARFGPDLSRGPNGRSIGERIRFRRIDRQTINAGDEKAAAAPMPMPQISEYERPEPELPSAAELLEAANAGYSLSAAAPNPVSSSASISFTLPRAGRTTLAVFDKAGRVIATLADETLDAGTHTRTFDASGLPAGLYLYRLSSGSYAETKTMTVVR